MHILAVNCGSSTLKFKLFATSGGRPSGAPLARGTVDRIGNQSTMDFVGPKNLQQPAAIADHGQAMHHVLQWLSAGGVLPPEGLGAVGHRVVHGADRFVSST